MSRLDLAVITALIVGGALSIEARHQLVIEPPTRADDTSPARAAGCPDNENEPYSASCLLFMGIVSGIGSQAKAAEGTPPATTNPPQDSAFHARASASSCPDSDNVPYSADCLKFLSGRYWRTTTTTSVTPSPAVTEK